ncbi:MAG TPA: zinc ribbon domain-containing protein [Chloroflexia bacterium]|nr:zinc ribbon domain-containing protein [Chloroflexia bacterium]
MPIYEYRCPDCKRRVSVFFRTMSAAQSGAATAACPQCGGQHLQRLVSKISFIRADNLGDNPNLGGATTTDELADESLYGGYGDDPEGFGEMMQGVDEDDPRSVARWARQMQRQTGEDLGPGFDTALTRIESGEDPDKVMDEMEPAFGDAGGAAGDDAGADFD